MATPSLSSFRRPGFFWLGGAFNIRDSEEEVASLGEALSSPLLEDECGVLLLELSVIVVVATVVLGVPPPPPPPPPLLLLLLAFSGRAALLLRLLFDKRRFRPNRTRRHRGCLVGCIFKDAAAVEMVAVLAAV